MLPVGLKSKLVKLNFLVADAQEMLSLLVPYLQDMGVKTIHRATNGPAALEILHQSKFRTDIVICDWDLPKLNGLEVLQFVRKNFGKKPFLMLSTQVTRESIAAAAKHGVDGYLAKPFTLQLLENRVATLLRALPDETAGKPKQPKQPVADADDADDDSWEI